jgi:enterochelin esterase-like enzyme
LTFRLADPEGRYAAVRLCSDLPLSDRERSYARADDGWLLEIDPPGIARLEYHVEVLHHDGASETGPDPGNPLRAPGAFGEKSVLELPGYRRPLWLDAPAPEGERRTVTVPTRSLGEDLDVVLWSPTGLPDTRPAPLVVVHDGPEYDALAGLTTYLSAWTAARTLPPVRAALLPPGPRNDRYSGDGAYTRALCLAVLPRLRSEVATTRTVGMGASLGALALLHAQRLHAGSLDGLFLQSGSFFHPRHDAHEKRFEQYDRVVRSVANVLRSGGHPAPVPTVMTCGTIEENLANNRIMARALSAQGYDVTLREVRDVHNYTAWRDALDPWLTGLLRELAR